MKIGRFVRGIRHTLSARYPLDLDGMRRAGPYPLDWRAHAPFRLASGEITAMAGPHRTKYANPVAIAFYALARHADDWHRQDAAARAAFLDHARHLVVTQDSNGGWSYPISVARYRVSPGWYSAMGQGLALSVLVRSHAMTGDQRHAEAARRAAALLWTPMTGGGCTDYDAEAQPFPEECPSTPPSRILNGALFALIGAWEASELIPEQPLEAARRRIAGLLPEYDLGYWSRYDLWSTAPASYAYHALHITLLRAVEALAGGDDFATMADAWERQRRNVGGRLRAAVEKARSAVSHAQ